MPIDELLRWVAAAGYAVRLREGQPVLSRERPDAPPPAPELVEQLRADRAAVAEYLALPGPRRLVRINAEHGPPLEVLAHVPAEACLEAFRRAADARPGLWLAGEWLREREFYREWVRFWWFDGREALAREEEGRQVPPCPAS